MELVFLSLESPRMNHESDFSGLRCLNKEHTTSLKAGSTRGSKWTEKDTTELSLFVFVPPTAAFDARCRLVLSLAVRCVAARADAARAMHNCSCAVARLWSRTGSARMRYQSAVVFWLGFRFWWVGGGTHGPNWAVFFASLAVVDTWGDQPPSVGWSGEACGARGGATRGAALTFAPGQAAGAVFSHGGGRRRDKWLDRAGVARRSWARKNYEGRPSCSILQHLFFDLTLGRYGLGLGFYHALKPRVLPFQSRPKLFPDNEYSMQTNADPLAAKIPDRRSRGSRNIATFPESVART
jgi:hypothetical protein